MNTKLRLFIDESGDMNSTGYHVISVITHIEDEKGGYHKILDEVTDRFEANNLNYRTFHTTNLNENKKKALLKLFSDFFTNKLKLNLVKTELKSKSDYDIYFPFLVHTLFLTLRSFILAYDNASFEIFLEDRTGFNSNVFKNIIFEKCSNENVLKPKLRILNFPKGENVLIALTDLYANTYFCDLEKQTDYFSDKDSVIPHCIETVPLGYFEVKNAKKIHEKVIRGLGDKTLTKTVTKTVTKTKIVEKELTKIVRDNSLISDVILNDLLRKFSSEQLISDNLKNEIFFGFFNKLLKYNSNDRAYEISKFIDYCHACLDERSYDVVLTVAEFLFYINDMEISRDEIEEKTLKIYYIKSATLWLEAHNHIGDFEADNEYIRNAEKIADELKSYTDCWSDIANLYNRISIAYQNIFEYEKAAERIKPIIDHFDNMSKNPFSNEPLTGRYIGALYGNYSQSLFFQCHSGYFFTGGADFERSNDEAIEYSEMSEMYFEDQEDIDRQSIYRAHGYMQKAVLKNDFSKMDSALRELLRDRNASDMLKNFFKNPEKILSNDLYRVAAFLKFDYLNEKHALDFIDNKLINKAIKSFPPKHPFEQILGYLMLLGKETNTVIRLIETLDWGGNIVELITIIFVMQYYWNSKGKIDSALLNKLNKYSDVRLIKNWKKYGVIEQLNKMEKQQYKGIGPISILPYNYC